LVAAITASFGKVPSEPAQARCNETLRRAFLLGVQMAKAFIIADIPAEMLKAAYDAVQRGQVYTIHLQTNFIPNSEVDSYDTPDTIDESSLQAEATIPEIEIARLTKETPVTPDEIITAKTAKEKNGPPKHD
jgi:hypothetical protein